MVGEVVRVARCYSGALPPALDTDVDHEATKGDDSETISHNEAAEVDDSSSGPEAALQGVVHVLGLREQTVSFIYGEGKVLCQSFGQGVDRKLDRGKHKKRKRKRDKRKTVKIHPLNAPYVLMVN